MRRRTKICCALIALLVGSAAVALLWWRGAFSPSPKEAIKDTLARANRGDYAGAVSNLTANMQNSWWNTDPEVRKATLDAVTHFGEYRDIDVDKVEYNDYSATVWFQIVFERGRSPQIMEFCILERGRWRPILKATVEKVAPDFNAWSPKDERIFRLAVAASKAQLQDAYTAVPNSKIHLRLPGNCQWSEELGDYSDPDLHFVVIAVERPNQGLKSRLQGARAAWNGVDRSLIEEKEVTVGGRKATLFRGKQTDRVGDQWYNLFLVFGTATASVMIEGRTPQVERLQKLLEESLMTTSWDP